MLTAMAVARIVVVILGKRGFAQTVVIRILLIEKYLEDQKASRPNFLMK